MTTEVAVAVPPAPGSAAPPAGAGRWNAEVVIARRAFAQTRISAAVCAVAFGGTAASSALSYATTFPTAASRAELVATTRADSGLAMLLGPIQSIETVGGYTVYKCFVFLTTIGAIWALLAATRLLRGEEDAGRWSLVLAGTTRPGRATGATLAALGAAIAVVGAGTAVLVALTGRSPEVGFGLLDSVVYGLSIVVAPAVFAAIGAVTSQLGRTRRVASGLGMGVFGVAFVLRMMGDAGPGTRWLLWTTPFGWTELMAPFTANDLRPLVPAVLTVALLSAIAVGLAARRDVGDGVLASRDVVALRPFGLTSPFGLTARLDLPVLGAWCAGAAVTGLVLGIIAKITATSIPSSMNDMLGRFGVQGAFVNQYLGVAFLLVATVVALLPAGQIGAACDEEVSGRLVHVLVGPTTRARWFAGRLLISALAVALAGLLAGLGTWLGAASQGVDLDLGSTIGAGLNVVPTALVALGLGAVVLSIAPRAASRAVYAVIIWSLLIDLLASMVASLSWLEHLALFHYMALAPAQPADPATIAITLAGALALCAAATMRFRTRDLATG